MKRPITLLIITFLTLAGFGQTNRDFKPFYEDGKSQFEKGQYNEAIVSFREALRLEPKAQKYKLEGTFFANYLPRYMLALCFEKTDIVEAANWVAESRTASESSIFRKREKARATYNADLERIEKGAKAQIAKIDAQYNLDLGEARTLLSQRNFEGARAAFQKLYTQNPNRPEATVGLGQVDAEKKNYLRQLELDFQQALINRDFPQAEQTIAQLNQVDSSYANLASMRSKLSSAREVVTKPVETPPKEVIAESKPDPKPDKPIVVADNKPRESRPPVTKPKDPRDDPAVKASLRADLLATLRAYRRGDPASALQQLEQISSPLSQDSGSYHWLRGLYLLTSHQHAAEADEALLDQAREAMTRATQLVASFEPDPKIYPEFVIDFYQDLQAQSPR